MSRVFAVAVLLVGLSWLGMGQGSADPNPIPDPVAPYPNALIDPQTSPYTSGGIYGESSPRPVLSLPYAGVVPGMVVGSNAPGSNELNTGTSGMHPGTNATQPGKALRGVPAPDFPANRFSVPDQHLPGQSP
ncbi:Uncharacterised protein [Mycobacteroides abscessus subsp. bolletii]|nr:Uncharacterised protein [Mycobacteroides abscessus subsp. bolletii]SKS16047.1 Uncharacterised protein [Mycobacteroides abscessus subsp. abscessus]BBB43331.1 hypothetical protein MASB_38970 [Mycobacteroides abscessus subsp. bolletii BD]SHW19559.1 Uncharacterised protein [Mycobacteroides abscessus subsp. bolletii]SHW51687.1 Uncharacterised protein [Mycobacteroides abscessus subsp. bolletii]